MKRVRSNRSLTSSLVRVLMMFIVSTSAAVTSSTIIFTSPLSALGATKDPGSRTLLPDLFTGTLSHAIPIDLPPGRKGLDPSLVLSYRSGSGNSWVGFGWDLNAGAVERSTHFGLSYDVDSYTLDLGGTNIDLIPAAFGDF